MRVATRSSRKALESLVIIGPSHVGQPGIRDRHGSAERKAADGSSRGSSRRDCRGWTSVITCPAVNTNGPPASSGAPMQNAFFSELRQATRTLVKDRGFSAVAVGTLGVGLALC